MSIPAIVRRGFGASGSVTDIPPAGYQPALPDGRHYDDTLFLTLLIREASYDTAPTDWNAAAVAMADFDDASPHETWDDLVETDEPMVHDDEYATIQEIVRQSVRMTYREPRVKPSTIAGLMGLALGDVVSTQDGTARAWRHDLQMASNPLNLHSISAQTCHQKANPFTYTGLKADSVALQNNGPYLALSVPLIGSGTRRIHTTAKAARLIPEPWLR